ncbi:MAG: class I SAM-dependent methyltransferase [Deltaproteobacteria bacterium]|nr:class I SAM-dependent methyltransferase [Deltaproteobacteria bacterium]MBM4321936.1 class I SAM-dependent methyltransferase [Deltaproteobacteria bacterium]
MNDVEKHDLIAAYDQFAEWFQMIDSVYYKPEQTEKLTHFMRKLKHDIYSILDCACGIGSVAIYLAKNGFMVSCSDASERMLMHTKRNAESAGASAVRFYKSDWRNLDENVVGKFDCIINLGVSIYHLDGADLLAALRNMKAKLNPGGLLILDNKNWQEVLRVNEGKQELRLIEKRQIVRVFNGGRPLPLNEDQKYYFFDIAWSEGRQWIMKVVRLPAREVHELLSKRSIAFLNIDNQPISIKIRNGIFTAKYCHNRPGTPFDNLPHESIPISGWPVSSSNLAELIEQIGFENIKILDKYKELYEDNDHPQMGLYDLIIAFNPR